MLAPGWWRYGCRVGRCVVTNVGPTQESDLHVSVYADGEVSQVGSRVELFEEIRRDRRAEGLSVRELAERHKVHRRAVRQALASTLPPPRKEYGRFRLFRGFASGDQGVSGMILGCVTPSCTGICWV